MGLPTRNDAKRQSDVCWSLCSRPPRVLARPLLSTDDNPRLLVTRTRFWRARFDRLASSSSIVGIATMLPWRVLLRNQPRQAPVLTKL